MGTRLLSEYLIKNHYPHLKYIRIHTGGKNTAVIYAWNEELQLPDKDIASLQQFASGHLLPYICFKVKAYPMVQDDKVPPVYELPDDIIQAAMSRNLDQYGIVGVINNMLSEGHMIFNHYDAHTGTIHFDVHTTAAVTAIEKDLISQYLYEIIPIGSTFEVTYR
ncbi:hypothetical protein [Paenibacillus abyssi]|uniref:Uncharacterized protein n=1 Tax=Paenibacillus abyssi TaxID=1340531 RepID=A0A917CI67_9BACL|nr:hypothetical protein [Paenibacillus abyssi]GGF89444.1 hypothetical protein GCM10010916_03480 [Paenibacillus abyssi]